MEYKSKLEGSLHILDQNENPKKADIILPTMKILLWGDRGGSIL